MAPSRRGGRGRRGGGRPSRFPRAHRRTETTDEEQICEASTAPKFDAESFNFNTFDSSALFLDAEISFAIHLTAQEQNKWRYLAAMSALKANGVDLITIAKVRALAAAIARHDAELTDLLLSEEDLFTVAEVHKAVTLLDAGRRARVEEKSVARLKQAIDTAGKKGKNRLAKRINRAKINVHNISRDILCKGTLSGAVAKRIRKWTRRISKEQLEFFALHLPRETWRQLADVVHLNPDKDFPNAPWFLRYCFDEAAAPQDSLAARCRGISAANVNELVLNYDIPFSHLKPLSAYLNAESKTRIAHYATDLDSLLWNYEDLRCEGTDRAIFERLTKGEAVTLPYGKLMERLLVLRKMRDANAAQSTDAKDVSFYPLLMPFAEKALTALHVPVECPVVVIGDASASMNVAIETSTIIASFLCAMTNAQLVFFSNNLVEPAFIPKTVEQVIELAMVTKTIASTCHASALLPFYERKQIVKTFIVCTDEEENTLVTASDGHSYLFQPLFDKYYREVYPAKLVFISFLSNQHSKGQMVEPLRNAGYDVMQFKLDAQRPDLSKLNNLVGQLAMQSTDFNAQVDQLEQTLRANGLQVAFEQWKADLST